MAEQEELGTTIKRRKWKWMGHTPRKPESSWGRTTSAELQKIDASWREAKRKSQNIVVQMPFAPSEVKRIKARQGKASRCASIVHRPVCVRIYAPCLRSYLNSNHLRGSVVERL